jgi:hypothetical protein
VNATAGAIGAATAAAAHHHAMLQREEEDMTAYRREDLVEDWEFKILRSTESAFRDPEQLRRILEDEARAGWVLIEKFDDQRVRLKRKAGRSSSDFAAPLDFDPYRTYVGLTPNEQGRKVAIATVATILVIAAVILLLVAVLG